jgi:hypothetical protein
LAWIDFADTTEEALEQVLWAHNHTLKEASDREQRLAYIAKTKSEVWPVLFQRTFQADHNRKSFMSLPRELRDTIYSRAFNDLVITQNIMKLRYDEEWTGFTTSSITISELARCGFWVR